jgi:hypothetical protein
MTDQV